MNNDTAVNRAVSGLALLLLAQRPLRPREDEDRRGCGGGVRVQRSQRPKMS